VKNIAVANKAVVPPVSVQNVFDFLYHVYLNTNSVFFAQEEQ
jgi:hypothetical protein